MSQLIETTSYIIKFFTFTLPASGKSEVWRYKATYREDDAQVGLWSDEVSITVTSM